MPPGPPEHDLEPHSGGQIHPEMDSPIRVGRIGDSCPVDLLGLHIFCGLLLMPLVEAGHSRSSYGLTGVGQTESEVEGIVVNALVLVAVLQPEGDVEGLVCGVV